MIRILYLYLLVFVFAVCCSNCSSSKDRHIQQLFDDIGAIDRLPNISHLVITPGYGCSDCLEEIKQEIRRTDDTVFVVMSRSEKDFYLLTGRHVQELPNVFLDKNEKAMKLGLVKSFPIMYALRGGKIISCKPFSVGNVDMVENPLSQTLVNVDRTEVDWQSFPYGEKQKAVFVLTNVGNKELHIDRIDLSCECLAAEYGQRLVLPNDTLHLNITFEGDQFGEFIRDIYIYGNFPSSPMELTVKGIAIK